MSLKKCATKTNGIQQGLCPPNSKYKRNSLGLNSRLKQVQAFLVTSDPDSIFQFFVRILFYIIVNPDPAKAPLFFVRIRITYQDPQSNEITREPPELFQHFRS